MQVGCVGAATVPLLKFMVDLHRTVSRKIDKAIFDYNLIEPGYRILLGISGGKDSLVLLRMLAEKQPRFSIPFELHAAHVGTEYSIASAIEFVRTQCETWNVPFHLIPVNLESRLKQGRSLSCYWCSTQRRTELLRFAEERGFDKIALGHHMDDILTTFLMNLTHKGELSTMLPRMSYDKYRQSIIRPLAWVDEEEIIALSEDFGFGRSVCKCGFDTTSKRKVARRTLALLEESEGRGVRKRIMEALHNPKLRYLIRRATSPDEDTGKGLEEAGEPIPEERRSPGPNL